MTDEDKNIITEPDMHNTIAPNGDGQELLH